MRWGRMEEEIEGVRVLDRGWESGERDRERGNKGVKKREGKSVR